MEQKKSKRSTRKFVVNGTDESDEKFDTSRYRQLNRSKQKKSVKQNTNFADDYDPESHWIHVEPCMSAEADAPPVFIDVRDKERAPIGDPMQWAVKRFPSLCVSDSIAFRQINALARFIGTTTTSSVFSLSPSFVNNYLPHLIPFCKSRGLTLVETSFAVLNETHLSADIQSFQGYHFIPPGRTRRQWDQCKNDDTFVSKYISPTHTNAQPFASARLHAIASVAEIGDNGKMRGHGILKMFDQWICSGEGTTHLLRWNKDLPMTKDLYVNSISESRASVEDYVKVIREMNKHGPAVKEAKLTWLCIVAAECAVTCSTQTQLPADPRQAVIFIHNHLRPLWEDERLYDEKTTIESHVLKKILFIQKCFHDTIQYTIHEPITSLLSDAILGMRGTLEKKFLTIPEMRAIVVWIIQALIACAHLQTDAVNAVFMFCRFENMFLVPDDDEAIDVNVDYFQYTLPSAVGAKPFSIYLPRVYHQTMPVHCTLGAFDNAVSELHGVGPLTLFSPHYDPLSLAANLHAPMYSHVFQMFDESYRRHIKPSPPDVQDSAPLTSIPDGADSDDDDTTLFTRTKSVPSEATDDRLSRAIAVEGSDVIDFPNLSDLLKSFGMNSWQLDANGFDIRRDRSARAPPGTTAIWKGSLTATTVLETSPEIKKYFTEPPLNANIYSFQPMGPTTNTYQDNPRLKQTLTEIWTDHVKGYGTSLTTTLPAMAQNV